MQPLGRGRRGSKVAAAVARLQQQARAFEDDEQQFGGHPPSYDGADRIHPAEPWSPERAREFDRRPAGARVAPAPPPVETPRNAVPPEYTLRKAPATPPDGRARRARADAGRDAAQRGAARVHAAQGAADAA